MKWKSEIKTTLVIPVLNEENSIISLLNSIKFQSVSPNQIIIVDAGSIDKTCLNAKQWWEKHKWGDVEFILIEIGKLSYPGRARNFGIRNSSYDWIIFIDAGITPNRYWIESLKKCASSNPSIPASFGLCEFEPNDIVSTAVTIVSFGIKVKHRALPASIFHKSVFKKIGYFREDLRAAEDHEWFSRFIYNYNELPRCENALVYYQEIPNQYYKVFLKWKRSAYFSYLARTKRYQAALYIISPIIFIATLFINYNISALLVTGYFLTRVFILPLIKNKQQVNFLNLKLLYNIFLSILVIDIAKFFGFVSRILKEHISKQIYK